jgi:Ser/Thr protein kinase RdoA (MazF antagonist)
MIEAEIELIIKLSSSGLNVIKPIKTLKGEYLTVIDAPEGERVVMITEAIEGVYPTSGNQVHEREFGSLVADMYKIMDKIETPIDRNTINLNFLIDKPLQKMKDNSFISDKQYDLFYNASTDIKAKLESLLKVDHAPSYGLCHGDLGFSNALVNDKNKIQLIDFDFSGYGWRYYDLAVHLGSVGLGYQQKDLEIRKRRLDNFLEGFSSYWNLNDIDIDIIHTFVPCRRLLLMGNIMLKASNVFGCAWEVNQIKEEVEFLNFWLKNY